MAFGTIISSPRGDLSPQQALYLANFYLENARKETDPAVALVLCNDGEVSLSHVKRSKYMDDPTTREGMASVYGGFGDLMERHGHQQAAQAFFKKCEKWGGRAPKSDQPPPSPPSNDSIPSIKGALISTRAAATAIAIPSSSLVPQTKIKGTDVKRGTDIAKVPESIFPRNIRPPLYEFKPPQPDARLDDTPQLVYCLGLMQTVKDPDELLDSVAQSWLQIVIQDADEQERLKILATGIIRAFKKEEIKDAKAVTEVVQLAPVLESNDLRHLLKEFFSGIEQSDLLDVHQLEGLAQLLQSAEPGQLDADDLVRILKLFSSRLMDTHQQSGGHIYQLTLAVSHVLDAMADAKVSGLDRETLHEPLLSYLESLKKSPDTYMVYQAAYAFQALLCVPDNESLWKATLRRTGKVVKGVSRLVSAVKGIDLNAFIDGLVDIQQGVAGAMDALKVVKDTYDDVKSLAEGGKSFVNCMKDGLTFNRKCAWYTALRGADTLIQEGQFSDFRKLVCEAPCRRDPAFQWGVCQRLGELAVNTTWDPETQRGAITFLGEIYGNDKEWGSQSTVKQWILNILLQLSIRSGKEMQFADSVLQELRHNGDAKKQALYRACEEKGPGSHPLKIAMPHLGHPSLLDRVQEKPDVEGHLRLLRRQRLKERGNVVYIPPQAKANLQARDEDLFPLMEKVSEFMSADQQQVYLLLGDSGSGKSTFNRQLEYTLWQGYKKSGPIPLLISLPSIEKPEHDMIAKQLRKLEFTEPQIREMKTYRDFILICDGYDESQQTRNLYMSNRLNQTGEWKAKMVISCRSEYVGADYRDRFQPGDRNHQVEPGMFQEAVMTPFSLDQVEEYIDQYVSVHKPLWEAKEYKQALDQIPSLKDLVKNPFLMSLSLEVLPRMVDLDQNLSTTRVTRVSLYDHFIEHWLERGKKRLGEKNLSPQARAAFESLSDEGFTPNGIDFLKKLSVAIYRYQDGQPIVRYSRYKDEGTWKATFFSREDEKQLLREACPLTRSGNQHRFIHRSLLEYGLALAVFDPVDWREKMAQEELTPVRRGSIDSEMSFVVRGEDESITTVEKGPDITSPLAWRRFVGEASVLQFLEERVQQEPIFKQQLLDFIEHSKTEQKWRTAAANAITILVRAGVQFNYKDLKRIQIPGADLSYGVFESVQLQEADLRHVNLRGAWMQDANLSEARMIGAQFGELPNLPQDDWVRSCAYSPDGTLLAVGLLIGKITVYQTESWDTKWTSSVHQKEVWALRYSPKGGQLASCCHDGTARLWNLENGDCFHVLTGHNGEVKCIMYSVQGHEVATGGDDGTVRIWSTETGECTKTLTGHTNTVCWVEYSPNEDKLVSSSHDYTVRLWDTETGDCIHVLIGHSDWVRRVLFLPQGDQIVSASDDATIQLWSVKTGECLQIWIGHEAVIWTIACSPNGDQIASASKDTTVRLWEVQTGTCRYHLTGHSDEVSKVVFSPRGDQLASSSDDNTVRLWDPESGTCLRTLSGHTSWVTSVVYSPKGDQVASSSNDQTVRLWDVKAGTSHHIFSSHSWVVRRVLFSPNGAQVASGGGDATIRLWDTETGVCQHVLVGHEDLHGGDVRGEVNDLAYSPRGDLIASSSYDNTARLWDTATGECLHVLRGHEYLVHRVAFSPSGQQLISSSGDGTTRFWDVESGVCTRTLMGYEGYVPTSEYDPQGNRLAISCEDTTVRLLDMASGECLHELRGHTDYVQTVAFSTKGDLLASGSGDMTVRLWESESGTCRHVLTGHESEVTKVEFSPRDDQIASMDSDNSIRLWDVATGECSHVLEGHDEFLRDIAYSPRGDILASTSWDQTVRLWDVVSGQCIQVIRGFRDGTFSLAWYTVSEDDYYLTVGCEGGAVMMWRVIINSNNNTTLSDSAEDNGDDRNPCDANLRWRTTKGVLNMKDATIQDVRGLGELNRKLLRQRGAVGEPVHLAREVRKLVGMASAIAKLQSKQDSVVEQIGEPEVIDS